MAAMKCPVHGSLGDTTQRFCPECMEFLVPDVPSGAEEPEPEPELCPEPGCGTELEDGRCPLHSLGAGPTPNVTSRDSAVFVEFPWGPVQIGADEVWVGRDEGCGALVPERYGNVSRRHAVFWCRGSTLYVRDQTSTNGTFVNSRPLPANEVHPLRNGDQVRFAADLTVVVRAREERR